MLLFLLACVREEAPIEIPQEVRIEEMDEHYAEVERARDAIIDGDVAAAAAQGRALAARLPAPELPVAAAPHQEALRAQALALAGATTLDAAAGAIGDLSATCGSCHRATGALVYLPPLPDPPQEEGFEAQMQRYHWAVRRMWQGLVLPDEGASGEALATINHLPTAPFRPDWLEEMPVAGEMMDEAIHSLAANAAADGEVYGRLLANCAGCHTQVRDP